MLILLTSLTLPVLAEFEPPPLGAPGRREDAGSRPGCPVGEGTLTAMVPATNLGLTLDARPIFWLYVPFGGGELELILKDDRTSETVYRHRRPLPDKRGLVAFPLPDDAPPLDYHRPYRWKFDLLCHRERTSDFLSVNGVVQRTCLVETETGTLQRATPADDCTTEAVVPQIIPPDTYAAEGIWFEVFDELARQRQASPDDAAIEPEWTALLSHPLVQLAAIADAPLLGRSQPEQNGEP